VPNKEKKSIKPNLTARLKSTIIYKWKAVLIPQSIISESTDGEQYVYVMWRTKMVRRKGFATRVIHKANQGDVIEVLEGIEE
jgi:hypothetical protein